MYGRIKWVNIGKRFDLVYKYLLFFNFIIDESEIGIIVKLLRGEGRGCGIVYIFYFYIRISDFCVCGLLF